MQKAARNIKRVGSIIGLRREFEERYIILHKYTFPGVLERIRLSHIRNYSIFLKDGILLAYYEYTGRNYDADMKAISKDKTTQEWWKLTDPMQQPLQVREKGEWWAVLEEILHAGAPAKSPSTRHAFVGTCPRLVKARTRMDGSFKAKKLQDLITRCHVHNLSIYSKVSIAYAYFEYSGRNLKADLKVLNASFHTLLEDESLTDCVRFMDPPWSEMREVFHTD